MRVLRPRWRSDVIQDNLPLMVELTQHKRSVVLEVAVIALIAMELLLAFVRH